MMPTCKKRFIQYVLSLVSVFVLFSGQSVFATEELPTDPTIEAVSPTLQQPSEVTENQQPSDSITDTEAPQTNEENTQETDTQTTNDDQQESQSEETLVPTANVPVETVDATTTTPIVILHTNDIHGRLESSNSVIGVAKLSTVVEEQKTANPVTLVLDAGDAFQGMPISNNSKGSAMAAIMNTIGYDAMAVGNHEFDFGFDEAVGYKNLLNFPLLSTNVYKDGVRVFQPYTVITRNGVQFAIIGVTTPETATKTHPNNVVGVSFADPIPEVEKVIAEINTAHPTISNYIILAHLGVDETTKNEWRGSTLAQSLSTNNTLTNKQVIVIDGHSHTKATSSYGNVLYTQTGSYLENIGKISYTNGQNDFNATYITAADTANTAPNATVAALVQTAKDEFAAQNAEVVVTNNPVELSGDRANVRVRETNLGNLVTDAIYQYGQTGFANPTDIAVTNGGGLRASLVKDAPITKGDIISVLPFGNVISQIQVTGAQIQEMFAFSLRSAIQTNADGSPVLDENGLPLLTANGGFLQASGVKVFYDTKKEPANRILAIHVLNRTTGQYEPLDPAKTYYLVTNDFLAAGGDGYTMLHGARQEGPSMDTVLASYIPTVNLSNYATIAPNNRIVSIDSAVDSDNDGHTNSAELAAGFDPFNANSKPSAANNNNNNDDDDDDQTNNSANNASNTSSQATQSSTTQKNQETKNDQSPGKQQQKELPNTGSTETFVYTTVGFSFLFVGVLVLKRKVH